MKTTASILMNMAEKDMVKYKEVRKFLKNLGKGEVKRRSHGDRYAVSLQNEPRRIAKDYDSCAEYGFIEADGCTDGEIREWLDENVRIPHYCSPYDCTGKAFTMFLDWHRNPCGLVSYKHTIGYDV